MSSSPFEYIAASLFNRARRKIGQKRRSAAPEPVPPGHLLIGETLPDIAADEDEIEADIHVPEAVSISPGSRLKHIYAVGSTGSGKTNLALRLIESDIENRRALCVLDLRGDLVDRVLMRLAAAGSPDEWRERLLLIDLRRDDFSVGFNPLVGDGDTHDRALMLLEILGEQAESWGVQLAETLRNALLALAETGWSLLEVEPLLTNAAFRAEVLLQVADPHVKAFFAHFEALSEQNKTAWTLPVLNKVTPLLAAPQLRRMFGQKSAPSFRNLIDGRSDIVILVALGADRLHGAAETAGAVFVRAFQNAILSRVDQMEHERVPTHLYLDEFQTMASTAFESIVAEGRRFGLGLYLSHQNAQQLPKKLRGVLRNNVGSQFFFQTGAGDAKELAKEVTTDAPSKKVKAALIAQEVGQAFLVRRGQPTVRVQTIPYDEPCFSSAAVSAIRAASFATYARPCAEIDQELLEREEHLRQLDNKPVTSAPPTYEIRHAKTSNFKPRDGSGGE